MAGLVLSSHSDSDGSDLNLGVGLTSVLSLLPDMQITTTTKPTVIQANQLLTDIANNVKLRIGDFFTAITDDDFELRILLEAQRLIRLGTASMIDAAAHPDVQTVNGSNYEGMLWKKYTDGLTALVEVLDHATPGDDPALPGGPGSVGNALPLVSSPPPTFFSSMPF